MGGRGRAKDAPHSKGRDRGGKAAPAKEDRRDSAPQTRKAQLKEPEAAAATDMSGDIRPEIAAASEFERPAQRAQSRHPKQRGNEKSGADTVFGESEYVPAFLLRPTRASSK